MCTLVFPVQPVKFSGLTGQIFRSLEKPVKPNFTVIYSVTGGNYFHFVLDPFTVPAVAKESEKLSFRIMTKDTTRKIFGIIRRDTGTKTGHGILPKYLQVGGMLMVCAVM